MIVQSLRLPSLRQKDASRVGSEGWVGRALQGRQGQTAEVPILALLFPPEIFSP